MTIISRVLYILLGVIIGFLISIGMVSNAGIENIKRIEVVVNEYGLNAFMYGCIEGRKSDLSCYDVTKENEKNITLPRLPNEDSSNQ